MQIGRWTLKLGALLALMTPLVMAQECKLPAQASPTSINLVSFRFPMMEYFASAIEACGKDSNIKVSTTFLQADAFNTQVGTALAARGNSPYQIIWSNPNFVTQWGTKGWLLPLNVLIAKYGKRYGLDDISQQLWNNGKINGRQYGIPVNFNTQVLFYRKDIFDELGLKPPTSFDEFQDVLKKLDASKKTKVPSAIAFGGTALAGEFHSNLMAFGGKWFENGRPAFNSEAGLKAAQAIRDWLPYMAPETLSYTNDNVMVALQQGDIAISKIWITRAAPMEDPNVSKVVGKIAYAPAFRASPGGAVAATAEGDMYSIPASTPNPELAFLAVMEALKQTNQLQAAKFGMVSRSNIANNPDLIKANRSWPAASLNAKGAGPLRPFVPYMGIANNIVSRELNKALASKGDLKAALDAAAQAVEAEMKVQGFLK
jgi:ABC-type glycerol-3-phosphate transport system substrate-binding protein